MNQTSGVTLFFIILGIFLTEGVLLLVVYTENKKLRISKIEQDAKDGVEKLSDDQLRAKLDSELK